MYTKKRTSKSRPFVHIAQIDRPTMGLTAGFSKKSTPSAKYLQFVHISNFFQFFPKSPLRPDREFGVHMAICGLQSWPAADGRRRPCFRPGPAYANFFLLLAVGYMRPIFPESEALINLPRFFKHMPESASLSRRGKYFGFYLALAKLSYSICWRRRSAKIVFAQGPDR